jgi:uncharacterized protein (TIGR02265 family)
MSSINMPPTPPVGGVESDYERRIALATPEDTARGLFFNGVTSSVIALGGENALAQCRAQLNDPRLERRFVDFSSYPVADFLRMALAATRVLSVRIGGPEKTQRRLGMQAMQDFLSSMAGRTLLLLSGDSPKRVMGNLVSGYRSAVSYGERTVTLQGENGARVVMKRDFMLPLYNEGVLVALLEAVHTKNPQVVARPFGVLDCEYDLSWG